VTARDEAIEALIEGLHQVGVGMTKSSGEVVIDAIPGDVLVRLAIERGALVEWGQNVSFDEEPRTQEVFALYRVVDQ
jgi:hypothetical protein